MATATEPARYWVRTLIVGAVVATLVGSAADGTGVPAASAATDSEAVTSMGDYPTEDFVEEAQMLPPQLATSVERDLGLSPAEYLAQSVAALDAVSVVETLEANGVELLGSRMEGTELVVNLAPGADASAVAARGASVERGAPEPVDLSEVTFVPAFDVSGGEGYTWSNGDGSAGQCSIGLTGRRISDGRPMALTAGHCLAGMGGISGSIRQLVQTAPGTGGRSGQAIGNPSSSAFGSGFDGGLITLDAPGVEPQPSVLTWGYGTSAPRSSAPIEITGDSAAIVGASLCKSGSRTGWSCGVVRAVDETVNVGGNLVNSILATTCIQPGDSGGAAVMGRVAVGVNSSTSSAPCGSAQYLAAFFPMRSAAGKASVQSRFGSAWEPSVVVAAPTIDRISVPNGVFAGSMSGTARAPRVAIQVGDRPGDLMIVPVTNGVWSVNFSELIDRGVASGTSRVSAVAVVGSWSRSPGVESTVSFAGSPLMAVSGLIPADYVQG